jgi:hypothetical protein
VDDDPGENGISDEIFRGKSSRDGDSIEQGVDKNGYPRKNGNVMKVTFMFSTSMYHEGIFDEIDEDESSQKYHRR